MTFVVVQRGTWQGVECDIELEAEAASAFLTAAHDYMVETKRPMPEIVEPLGGLRTIAETTEMRWAFDHKGTAASDAIYLKYNMSRVSTARPSINGTHTTGEFFDVATSAFLTWLLPKANGGGGNGARYGITRPLPNDPNHCRYTPGTATAALKVTSLGGSPTGIQGEAMSIILIPNNDDGKWYAQSPLTGLDVLVADADSEIMLRYMQWVHGTADDKTNRWNAAAFATVKKYIVAVNPPSGTGNAPVDLAPVLAAIAALDKQDDDYEAKLEALIAEIKIPTKITGTLG